MKLKFAKIVSTMLITAFAMAPVISNACTSFTLKTKDGSYVYGRTVEFAEYLPMKMALYPRAHQYKGTGTDGVWGSGKHWTGKYAFVGLNAYDKELITDGMNEKGLAGGMQYLPVSSVYQDPTGADVKNSIGSFEVVNYVLSNFDNVEDIKKGLPQIFVSNVEFGPWKMIAKMHYSFHDMTGKSIVVEYVKGKLNIYDNPTGAMSNEPPFDWQLMNLENYLNLSPIDVGSKTIGGVKFTPRGAGSGMHGLPGDFLPSSRFLRAAFYTQNADQYAADLPRVKLAWHLLNMFDIPPGTSVANDGKPDAKGKYFYDYTQQSTVADPKNLDYYARFFGGYDIVKFSMKDHDWNAKEVKMWEVPQTTTYKTIP